ncbi:unnamed protein product [Cuscuta epithymum]|uniref:CRM domain-containing protein n=1 Tax=Cuscuta epithymum TaxID=186058 RepID=A0AAV0G896_9ASTE|nr:unnamed protein product [Cuscuta epithymum]
MASKPLISCPIFAPPFPSHHHRPGTAVGFSRWNNANAEKFNRQERTQKEIEDEIRFHKRHNAALNIISNYSPAPPSPVTGTFKSIGTPSAPSKPSIPGKKSKYSKPPKDSGPSHPAFRPVVRLRKIPDVGGSSKIYRRTDADEPKIEPQESSTNISVNENGVTYEFPEAPFVYQYSYTETPKMKPLKLREPLVMPFESKTMTRPWTGRKPLPPSKKKLPEFDSFKLPPPHKKGVKPVQAPGPFLAGSGPKYAKSREDIMGEPLTKEEIEEHINSCKNSKRQLNMGRDGLTHNMLENIHALWKRKRVCKIKCKGVCTVDMQNVREKLEEKTGGKIIYSQGGVIYLFRGRNYNYKTRPRFPLMLWRPITPVYPKLVQKVPEGLTLEEASEMRKKGRNLLPICKIAKNGVYTNLVKNVRDAFDSCELVRINCQGTNPSDSRKIGAKLKDLVPCVLISFEHEHILMWRGREWKPYTPDIEEKPKRTETIANNASLATPLEEKASPSVHPEEGSENKRISETSLSREEQLECSSPVPLDEQQQQAEPENLNNSNKPVWTEGLTLLLSRAIESGSAVVLDDSCLDADNVYKSAISLAKSAPPGPVFRHERKKAAPDQQVNKQETGFLEAQGIIEPPMSGLGEESTALVQIVNERKVSRKGARQDHVNVGLRIDELAKLLS